MNMTGHQQPSIREQIHDFAEGNLSDSETDQLWTQLIARPDDLDYFQTLVTLKKMGSEGKFDHLYDSEPGVVSLPQAREGLKKPFYEQFKPYLAAASVLIIGLTILFSLFTNVQKPDSEPISMIEYGIERSVDDQTVFDNHIQEAVSLATNNNFEAALSQLDKAANSHLTNEQVVHLQIIRGVIQYNSGNYSDALQTFGEVKKVQGIDSLSLEKGTWYLANTQLQLGMIEEAKESMKQVIEMDGAFSRIAGKKLENL